MKQPGVYILHSNKLDSYYIGSTQDVTRRLKEHNRGKVKSTLRGIPWSLRVFISCESISQAKKSELRLKKYKRRDIIEKMIESGIFPWKYNIDY